MINETFTTSAGLNYGHEYVIFGNDRSDIRMWLLDIDLGNGVEAHIRRDTKNDQQGVMHFRAPNLFEDQERIVTRTTVPFHEARKVIRSGHQGSASPSQIMQDLILLINGDQNLVWAEHYCGVGVVASDCEFCRDLDVLMDIEHIEWPDSDPMDEIVWPD